MVRCVVARLKQRSPLNEGSLLDAIFGFSTILNSFKVSCIPTLYLRSCFYSAASFALILNGLSRFVVFLGGHRYLITRENFLYQSLFDIGTMETRNGRNRYNAMSTKTI